MARTPHGEDDDHGSHLARPAPLTRLPAHRVVLAPPVGRRRRPGGGDGAQPEGAAHQRPLRDVAGQVAPPRPHAQAPRRDGGVGEHRLLLVRGLRLLDHHQPGHRPGQDARRPPVAGQRRLHRPRAAGAGVRRGGPRHAACGHRRDRRGPAPGSGRRRAGRADHDDRRGEPAVPLQQRPGPAQPGLPGPVRDPRPAGPSVHGPDDGVMTSGAGDELVAVFDRHRRLLFGVAYQMLGSVADAEDTVQDAWLRWSAADRESVADPRAFLVTIVSRLALDRLRSARAQRETYVGPWLPEPLLTDPSPGSAPPDPAEAVELGEDVSLAVLVVLETLSPVERAVFVLREVFGMSWSEVAGVLDRSEAAVRQLGHRAREHVQARRPRFDTDRRSTQEVTERFLAAAVSGDVASLLAALSPGVVLVSDGGGRVKAARRPIVGADKVARFLAAIGPQGAELGLRVGLAEVNGGPAIVAWSDEGPFMALQLVLVDGLVEQVLYMGNPDKLAGIAAAAH